MFLHALAAMTNSPHGRGSFKALGETYSATSDVIIVATLVVFSTIFLSSLIWVFFDARNRRKSGLIALLFIVITGWPMSFIWWLWLRPPIKARR
jgi:hypothetical protein